jgi:hypothetical protein
MAKIEVMVPSRSADMEEQRAFEEELLVGEATESLYAIVQSLGITQRELARRLQVSPGRVSQILSGGLNLTLRTLAGCGWALGVRFGLVPSAMAERCATPAVGDPPLPDWVRQTADPLPLSFAQVPREDVSGYGGEAGQWGTLRITPAGEMVAA